MKKHSYMLFPFLLAIAFSACKKEQAETWSDTIVNRWIIDKYYGYAVDSTDSYVADYTNYLIDIRVGGKYTERYICAADTNVTVNGTWAFVNSNTYLQLMDSSKTRLFSPLSVNATYIKLKRSTKNQQLWIKPLQ